MKLEISGCAMASSASTVVVASMQEHSAQGVRHRLHPNSMSLPIASPHLLLNNLLLFLFLLNLDSSLSRQLFLFDLLALILDLGLFFFLGQHFLMLSHVLAANVYATAVASDLKDNGH